MMALHIQEWGTGPRVAVLIHGLGNSSDSWWQVGPAHAVADLRPASAVYEDPAFTLSPDSAVADHFRAQKQWTLVDLEHEHRRWNDRIVPGSGHVIHLDDHAGFLAALARRRIIPSVVRTGGE